MGSSGGATLPWGCRDKPNSMEALELVGRADTAFADREVAAEAGPEQDAGEAVVEVPGPDPPMVVPRHPLHAATGDPSVLGLVGGQGIDTLNGHIAPGGAAGRVDQHGRHRRPAEARAHAADPVHVT